MPPHEVEYHFQIAPEPRFPPDLPSVVVEPGHTAEGLAEAEVAAEEDELMTIDTEIQIVELQTPSALT